MAGFQPFSCSPNWPFNVVNPDGSIPEIKWEETFKCYSVNGVLAPSPLSHALPVHARSVSMDTRSNDEVTLKPMARQKALGSPSSSSRVNVGISEPPTGSSMGESSRKRSTDHPMLFKLHKFVDRVEEYLLQVHEPTSSTTHYHHVKTYEDKGKWMMRVVTTEPGNQAVEAWLEDPTPPFFQKRSDLDFQQRLSGWTLESRARNNGRQDKFYYHQGKQYKSFVQVLTFVLYANKDLKDLRQLLAPAANN